MGSQFAHVGLEYPLLAVRSLLRAALHSRPQTSYRGLSSTGPQFGDQRICFEGSTLLRSTVVDAGAVLVS